MVSGEYGGSWRCGSLVTLGQSLVESGRWRRAQEHQTTCWPGHPWELQWHREESGSKERPVASTPWIAPSPRAPDPLIHVRISGVCFSPCWNRGGPGGTSWLGSTGGSGVSVSNCSRLIILTFLKFSTSCCRGYEMGGERCK